MNFYDVLLAKKLGGSGGGGGDTPTGTKQITENGTYNVSSYASAEVNVPASAVDSGTKNITENGNNQDVTGYAAVNVNVPNTYAAGDEGKVVSSGELVSQGSQNIDQNGTYDTTLKNEVVVNVGGGSTDNYDMDIQPYDVIYIDYDGNPVYWYTKADFLALSAHPANPSHTGLTAQGWNWTLADAKTYVGNHGKLVIGQNYTTSDGKTHIYIDIPDGITGQVFALYAKASAANGLTVDWGDGNTSTHGTGNSVSHTYANSGAYEITLTPAAGATYYLGYNGANNCIFGSNNSEGRAARSYVKKVHIGNSVTAVYRQCFQECRNLEALSIPTTTTSIDPGSSGSTFSSCDNLKGLVLPSGFAKIPYSFLTGAKNLIFISIPKSVTQIAANAFGTQSNNLNALRALTLPEITEVSGQILNVSNAEWFIMPGTYTALSSNTVAASWRLKEFTIPASVTSIAANAFVGRIMTYHVLATTPPTLANTNAFSLWDGVKIYVPYSADHSVLAAYQTASNWSTYASVIEEEPQ